MTRELGKANGGWIWGLILIYFIASVILHVEVGGWINGCFENLSRTDYNNIISAVTLLTAALVAYKIFRTHRLRALPSIVWLTIGYTIVAIILSFNLFFVINIEAIHFLQYGILAFLIKRFMSSYLSVAIICTLAGAYDELFQYLVLDTRATYYDFNDVFLDAVGAGIGLLASWLVSGGIKTEILRKKSWWKRPEWILLGITTISLLIAAVIGEFTINPRPTGELAFFTLFKEAPQGFWHYPTGPYARYHILKPIPGLLLICITVYIYGRLDKLLVES